MSERNPSTSNSVLIQRMMSSGFGLVVLFLQTPRSSSVSEARRQLLPQSRDNVDRRSAESLMNHADWAGRALRDSGAQWSNAHA